MANSVDDKEVEDMGVTTICLSYHYGGIWKPEKHPRYVGGKNFDERMDIDLLSVTHMIRKYKDEFHMQVTKLCYLKPGKKLNDNALMVLDSDYGINDLVNRVLELEYADNVHIYPYDEMVVKKYDLGIQASTNLMCAGVDDKWVEGEGLDNETSKTSDINMIAVEEGREFVANVHESNEDEILEASDGAISDSSSEFDVDSLDSTSDSSDDFEDHELEMQIINQSTRTVKYDGDKDNPFFLLGMTFASAEEARLAIARYSVARSTPLKLNPNEKHRIRAQCKSAGCPFYLWLSYCQDKPPLVVKKFNSEHNCLKDAKNNLASAKFLAREFKDTICDKPTTTVKDLMKTAAEKMHLYVSKSTCKRAKRLVRNELDGSYLAEFAKIGSYVSALLETNPGTTAKLELQEKDSGRFVFRRLYICFDALKRGWKAGCRPIIGLDGTHLKGVVKGQLLTAVGKDACDQIFPIAWAVIDKENLENWKWFIELLVVDLEIRDRDNTTTIVSDMQKGLISAVGDVLPLAEHRYCARHVYANWSKKWHSRELKKKFYYCVWSTFIQEFEDNLKRLGDISKEAAQDFMAYNPQFFCKAFFSDRCKSDACDNNFSESFNSCIKEARFKPILSMLDDIRTAAMNRLAVNKEYVNTWSNIWCNDIVTTYEQYADKSFKCNVHFNGVNEYEVDHREDRHLVKLDVCMCTCRVWDLTGIPCCHAIRACKHANKDAKLFISSWYEKGAYIATYKYPMHGMISLKHLKVDKEPCEPPPAVRLSGRPRVKRIRSGREKMKGKKSGNLTKKGIPMKCSICHVAGHNSSTCADKGKNAMENDTGKGKQKIRASENDKGKGKQKMKATNDSKCIRKTRRMAGMGLYIDDSTGNSIFNPGMSSETVINQNDPIASQRLSSNPDPVTRFPIPNERELREEQESSTFSRSSGIIRRIAFTATGNQAILPTSMPFKPPGPTWKGQPCTTRSALEKQRDAKKNTLKK